jgi:TPP-dependent pyruvate/acetoin dehydrogenase alpha subunit
VAPLVDLYRSLYLVRRAEEEVARVYPTDKIKSPVHLAIGQEAVAVGVCAALRRDDVLFGTYRSHATYLAKGGDLPAFVAELYGKATGCAGGKGGSMHLIDVAAGVMGTSAVVATTIPHAVGYGWALRQRGSDAIAVAFFGDGAAEEGVFAESLNAAQLKNAPVLFVCENNGLAIHSRQSARQAGGEIWRRAEQYGMPSRLIASGDVLEIADAATEAVAAIRAGGGPRFLECTTFRWREHVGPGEDWALGYRSADEARAWVENDPVARLAGSIDGDARRRIEAEVEAELTDAFAFAEASPFPAADQLYADLYAPTPVRV